MSAPHSGTMTPDSCVAQHISPSGAASLCPWFPKCSALNPTRRRATRRDTRSVTYRARNMSRPVRPGGKQSGALRNRPSAVRGGAPGRGQSPYRHVRPGPWHSCAYGAVASIAAGASVGFVRGTGSYSRRPKPPNWTQTSANGMTSYLRGYRDQYLTLYLDRHSAAYRTACLDSDKNNGSGGTWRAYPVEGKHANTWRCRQTSSRLRCAAGDGAGCNTIVIAASRRVVFATDADAPQCSVSTTVERVFRATCVDGASITEPKLAGVAGITAQPGSRSHASTHSYTTIEGTARARVRSDSCPEADSSTAVMIWRRMVAAAEDRTGGRTLCRTESRTGCGAAGHASATVWPQASNGCSPCRVGASHYRHSDEMRGGNSSSWWHCVRRWRSYSAFRVKLASAGQMRLPPSRYTHWACRQKSLV